MADDQKFDTWAIVEQMGHNKYAGRVSEQTFGGASLLRLDVPEIPPITRKRQRWTDDGYKEAEEVIPGSPAFTKFIGVASIFALTPCTEAAAMAAAMAFRSEPLATIGLPQPLAIEAAAEPEYDEHDDGEMED